MITGNPEDLINEANKLVDEEASNDSFQQLMAEMTSLEKKLFDEDVVAKVKTLPQVEIATFVSARSNLVAAINLIRAQELTEIAHLLEAKTAELHENMRALDNQLKKLENATAWTRAINSILGVIGDLVTL